jgi:hypothetical protein
MQIRIMSLLAGMLVVLSSALLLADEDINISGTWRAGSWGTVSIHGDRGTYTKTRAAEFGVIRIAQTGHGSFSGVWRESKSQGGTLTFTVDSTGNILEGTYRVDKHAEFSPGRKTNLKWVRTSIDVPVETRKKIVNALRIVQTELYDVEVYSDRTSFEGRLLDAVQVVGFDKIKTPTNDPVRFAKDRYRSKGLIITGEGGQYVHRSFGYPKDFLPSSGPTCTPRDPLRFAAMDRRVVATGRR